MNKAKNYLYSRLNILYGEKQILISKIRNIEIEIKEIEGKIDEMRNTLDVAFEIFSPRTKKNDFIRTEIDSLIEQKKSMQQVLDDLQQQYMLVEGDIDIIKEALDVEEEADIDEFSDEDDEDGEGSKNSSINNEIKLNVARNINDGMRILEQEEYEKQRIARDLHDSSIQVLTNLVHKCEICSKVINVDTTRAKLELEVMAKTLREVIDELRNMVYNLRPMSFEEIGFIETLRKEVNKLIQFSDVYLSMDIDGEYTDIPSIVLLTVIRIIMEATSNCLKHSKCNNINISVVRESNTIKICIKDDGVGFDVETIHRPSDDNKCFFGLDMMKERIIMLEGNIEISSEIGNGTIISCSIPV